MEEASKRLLHCDFHPDRIAMTFCSFQDCSRPICADCRIITEDGTFCSTECATQYHGLYAHNGGHATVKVGGLEVAMPTIYKIIIGILVLSLALLIISVYYPLPFFGWLARAILKLTR
jgi:hypothetical protein